MLKWAVHVPRKSYLPTVDASRNFQCRDQQCDESEIISTLPGSLRATACETRISSDKYMFYGRDKSDNKENMPNCIERPFPSPSHCKYLCNIAPDSNQPTYPLEKHIIFNTIDSLRLLSRRAISAHCNVSSFKVDFDSPANNTWNNGKDVDFRNTKSYRTDKMIPEQYASTLPALEIEYSPCGLIPGHILALCGIGDMYFEKPLYFSQQRKRYSFNEGEKIPHLNTLKNIVSSKSLNPKGNSSVGSTKMSELTLECMISTVLESGRKDRKIAIRRPKSGKHGDCPPTMSPTYTPAEDPASDLHKYRENGISDWNQTHYSYYRKPLLTFNEREVRSPHVNYKNMSHIQRGHETFPLRRQGVVRRKRKSTLLHSNIKNIDAPNADTNHNNFNNKCLCVGDFHHQRKYAPAQILEVIH